MMTNEELTGLALDHDERITRHTEQIKTCFKQIEETRRLTESVYKLANAVDILTREQRAFSRKVDALSGDVEEIKRRPARRWETVVSVVVTALATYILAQLGLV